MEVVGAVASVAQLAATVFKISKTLYEVGDALSNAPSDIKDLARDLETFSDELHLLSSLLDDKTSRYSDQVHRLTAKIIGDCATICVKIDKILRKLRSGSMLARIQWLYKEKVIMKLLARLRDLKLSLMGMLGMLSALKADVMMNAMGLQAPSLLQGNEDGHVSKETMIEVEETRKKLAGITIKQNSGSSFTATNLTSPEDQIPGSGNIFKTEQSTNKTSPANIFYSKTHSYGDDFKSVEDSYPSEHLDPPPPFISTVVLPGIGSLMQNAKAMESVQSFHSAVSFQQDDDSKPNDHFPEDSKAGKVMSYAQHGAQSPTWSQQPFDSQDGDHEGWRTDLIVSAMKRFKIPRDVAEKWVASLPSVSPISPASPPISSRLNFSLEEMSLGEEGSAEQIPDPWIMPRSPLKVKRSETLSSAPRAAQSYKSRSRTNASSEPPSALSNPLQLQAQAQAQREQSGLQQPQSAASESGSKQFLVGNSDKNLPTLLLSSPPIIHYRTYSSPNEDISTEQGQDRLRGDLPSNLRSNSPNTHHAPDLGDVTSSFTDAFGESYFPITTPTTMDSVAGPPSLLPSKYDSPFQAFPTYQTSQVPAPNLQSNLPVPKPEWTSLNESRPSADSDFDLDLTLGLDLDFDWDSDIVSSFPSDNGPEPEQADVRGRLPHVPFREPKDKSSSEEMPPVEFDFKVLNAIDRSRERRTVHSPIQLSRPLLSLVETEGPTTDIGTQRLPLSTVTQSSQLWWRTFARLQRSGPNTAQTLEQIWGDQSDLMQRAKISPVNSVSFSDSLTATALCIVLPDELDSMLATTEPQFSRLRQSVVRIESIVAIMKSTLAFKTGTLAWFCFYQILTRLRAVKNEESWVLSQLADIVTLIARYNVMESMYQQWPNMSLERQYEESIIELCEYVLKYFVAVLKALQVSNFDENLSGGDPLLESEAKVGDSARDWSSEAFTPLLREIERADEKCRSFTVKIVADEGNREKGLKRRVADEDEDDDEDGDESDDSDHTIVAEEEISEMREMGPLVKRVKM